MCPADTISISKTSRLRPIFRMRQSPSTGIDSPYEPPERPDLVLDTEQDSVETCLERLLGYLSERRILRGA